MPCKYQRIIKHIENNFTFHLDVTNCRANNLTFQLHRHVENINSQIICVSFIMFCNKVIAYINRPFPDKIYLGNIILKESILMHILFLKLICKLLYSMSFESWVIFQLTIFLALTCNNSSLSYFSMSLDQRFSNWVPRSLASVSPKNTES